MHSPGWPNGCRLAFAIRDDDVSYFTQPWMLDTVYGEAWKLGFKVSLAVVPNVRASNLRLVPPHLRSEGEYHVISENKELVEYLREKIAEGHVDVIQHGYSHEKEGTTPEFAHGTYSVVNQRIREGREILLQTLGLEISVFAAPHERISRNAMKSLYDNGLNLCRKFTAGRFLGTVPVSRGNLNRIIRLALLNPVPFMPIRDSIISLDKMVVVQWDSFLMGRNIDAQIAESAKLFTRRLSEGNTFVVAQHYWEYFDSWVTEALRKERLRRFTEFLRLVAAEQNVWKTGLSDIVDWTRRTET